MSIRRVALPVLYVAAGFVLAAVVLPYFESQNAEGIGVAEFGAGLGQANADGTIAAQQTVGQREVPDPSVEAGSNAYQDGPSPNTRFAELREAARARGLRAHMDALAAAGFSEERIEWLRRRTNELKQELQKETHERQKEGLDVDPMIAAYAFDEDLRLVEEIGLEEYERYRKALGRPMGAGIEEVPTGSIAEQVGLRPGDEIVGYDGERIFNFAQLSLAQRKGGALPATIEVKRDGRIFQLAAPRGPLGVTNAHVDPFIFGVTGPAFSQTSDASAR